MNLGQENERQEFKAGMGQIEKGLKSLTAMLNRHFCGTVYLGVDDNGEVVGLEVGRMTLPGIRSKAAELIDPRIILDMEELKDEHGKSYIRISAQGSNIPYSFNGRYYLRTAASDEQIGSELLRKMLVSGNTDLIVQMPSEIMELSFSGLLKYLAGKDLHVADSRQFFQNFGLLSTEGRYNYMAYLLSDRNTSIVKVMQYAGTDKTVISERISFSNQSLLITVQEVLDYFHLISLPKKVDMESGMREEKALFDFQAFREAWINACVHNSWVEKIPPSIHVYDNRIEIVSYGGLPYGLSMEGFFEGTSKPVNNRLFNVFITCGLAEQSGHGIPQIIKAYGKDVFSFRDGMVTVTIPFAYEPDRVRFRKQKEKSKTHLTSKQSAVLEYLSDNPSSSLQEVAADCSISLGGVKKIALRLQELDLLEREGSKKNGTWVIR